MKEGQNDPFQKKLPSKRPALLELITVTLEFCSIQKNLIKNIRAKFGISSSPQSLDDIDMKIEAITKFDKRKKKQYQKIRRHVMSVNYDVIVIFLIYGQFGAIRKQDSGRIVCKIYIFINGNILFYKNCKQSKKNI